MVRQLVRMVRLAIREHIWPIEQGEKSVIWLPDVGFIMNLPRASHVDAVAGQHLELSGFAGFWQSILSQSWTAPNMWPASWLLTS